jgi:hypothetical protein
MKKFLVAVAILFAVQLNAESSHSNNKERLITPTIWAVTPTMFACNLTNVDDKAHHVQVRIISNGKVLLESKKMTLEPRHTTNHKVKGLSGDGGPIYCEFTIEGDDDDFRGVAVLYRGEKGSDFVAVRAW